jgi:predicted nucleotidyltransferase
MLDKLFGSRLRAKAIGWLATHPDQRYFVRQLTSILGEDSTNLSRELAKLADLGILTCQEEGRQKYYQVNRDSPVFNELRGLAVKTFAVADILREALTPLRKRIGTAFIYGSFAEGLEDAQSDIDIAIIGDLSLARVSKVLTGAEEKLGREVNVSVYPPAEFRSKVKDGHHFVNSVLRGNKVYLIGNKDDLERLAEESLSD